MRVNVVRKDPIEEIAKERDRRLAYGFVFDGKRFQADDRSRANIGFAVGMAARMNDTVAGSGSMVWIAADNAKVAMLPQTIIAFGDAAMTFASEMYLAARTLKDLIKSGEALDIEDDALWPDLNRDRKEI
ncbi:DUF4376 domain-containing protein [Oryzifoliimicrobium ureilyticus]|uniref:DUF4376 domain-containing protein n=1 Tax=Oryzifoliimicrobium ureilyticus TaxID=3113724 RepID=UPI0030767021